MKKRRRPRLTLVKPVRFAPEEWETIRERASFVSLAPSVYVRQTALRYRLSSRVNSRAIHELARVGNNLNLLARRANATGRVEVSGRLEEVLREVSDAIASLVEC